MPAAPHGYGQNPASARVGFAEIRPPHPTWLLDLERSSSESLIGASEG
jgi:hypothetical protein